MTGLKQARDRAGLTQAQVAAHMGVDQSTISYWETDGASPRADKLPALAELLGCAIDDLFAANDKTNPSA